MKRWTLWLLSLGLMPAWAGPIYLQMEGIPGDVEARHHEGWIEVAAFDSELVGGRNPSAGAEPAAKTGAAAHVGFVKFTDKSSPKLAEALCQGRMLPKARFEFLTSDARAIRFYTVELEQVLVTSCATAGGAGGRPSEEVTLAFAQAAWTYTELAPSGVALADHQAQWDFVRQQGGGSTTARGLRVSAVIRPGQTIGLRWTPEPGRRYELLRSVDPAGSYVPIREIPGLPGAEPRFEELPAGRQLEFFLLRERE